MPTRNVVLTEHQAELVERLVSSSRYQNASEGLRLVQNQEAQAKARLKALRDAARVGIAAIEAGQYRTFDSPADLRRHLDTLRDECVSRGAAGRDVTSCCFADDQKLSRAQPTTHVTTNRASDSTKRSFGTAARPGRTYLPGRK